MARGPTPDTLPVNCSWFPNAVNRAVEIHLHPKQFERVQDSLGTKAALGDTQ